VLSVRVRLTRKFFAIAQLAEHEKATLVANSRGILYVQVYAAVKNMDTSNNSLQMDHIQQQPCSPIPRAQFNPAV
jgi:hypothetical protein